MSEQLARARLDPDGRQVVTIVVRGGYHPQSIIARAGVPLRLVFRREDEDACSERVVFSAPRLARRLNPTGTTTIDLPAQPPGAIRFTCGMGRYRGRIELVDDRSSSLAGAVRRRLPRPDQPLGSALVLGLGGVILVALVAALTPDTSVVVAAAGVVLIAWLVACLWLVGRSTEVPKS